MISRLRKSNKMDPTALSRALQPADVSVELPKAHTKVQRRADRHKVHRFASIEYPGGRERQTVVIDFSHHGARLRFDTPEGIPSRVFLRAPLVGINRDCVLVWQRGQDIGVEFSDQRTEVTKLKAAFGKAPPKVR